MEVSGELNEGCAKMKGEHTDIHCVPCIRHRHCQGELQEVMPRPAGWYTNVTVAGGDWIPLLAHYEFCNAFVSKQENLSSISQPPEKGGQRSTARSEVKIFAVQSLGNELCHLSPCRGFQNGELDATQGHRTSKLVLSRAILVKPQEKLPMPLQRRM
jgi:hypothetical protein